MSPELEIEYLDYHFTATLETRETGRVAVTEWQLDSVSRSKTLAWVVFDRFLKRNDFADEDDARASIVDWLEQLVSPRGAPLVEIPAAKAVAAGAAAGTASAVASDSSVEETISDVVVEIASDLDWIDMIAEWFTDGPA
ncbi:hypothetical protein [Burkholderia sp. USMB20]|uniref:hypothetical protein n=1 Tax=Burkholderia sp. USMB20 TaxID=1571773 RepID=UPI0005CF207C|nr:hypothetical protein [Burkholderia sp. USMB20]TGN95580.1 hypothetical protein PL79_020945 [Burkholderia sp. USMB20]